MKVRTKDSVLKESLKEIYENSVFPTVFVTKSLGPYYFNNAATMYFPNLCTSGGLRKYIDEEEREKLKDPECSYKIIELKANTSSCHKSYILSPVYSAPNEIGCYRVQAVTSTKSGINLKSIFENENLASIIEEEMETPLKTINAELAELKKSIKGENPKLVNIENKAKELNTLRHNLKAAFTQQKDFYVEEKTFFDLYETLQNLGESTGFIKITKSSYENSQGYIMHGRQSAFIHAILKVCRYVLLETCEKGKISVDVKPKNDKFIIELSHRLPSDHGEISPFCLSKSTDGRINFGLDSARKNIEYEGGNLIVKCSSNKIKILISTQCLPKDTSQYSLTSNSNVGSLHKHANEILELRDIVKEIKERRKKE